MNRGTGSSYTIMLAILLIALVLTPACAKTGTSAGNQPPVITQLKPVQNQTNPGGTVIVESIVRDPENDSLTYKWSSSGGGFGGSGANNVWQAPAQDGVYEIILTVEDGKGGTATSKATVSVSSNKPPVIISVAADPVNVMPGGSTNLNCTANDPDGDILRYTWFASEGSMSGTGNRVSWLAPSKSGDFGVTCVVADGKGAESKQTVTVKVTAVSSDTTIGLVRQESGTVSSSNEKDTTRYRVGDDEKNAVYRAFFSFDIFGLNKTKVRIAKLKFGTPRITGDPFNQSTGLTGLKIWRVSYGGGLPDYNMTGDNLYYAQALLTKPQAEIEVTPEINELVAAGASRFQIQALFYKLTNGQGAIDMVEWPDATLQIIFAPQ